MDNLFSESDFACPEVPNFNESLLETFQFGLKARKKRKDRAKKIKEKIAGIFPKK